MLILFDTSVLPNDDQVVEFIGPKFTLEFEELFDCPLLRLVPGRAGGLPNGNVLATDQHRVHGGSD